MAYNSGAVAAQLVTILTGLSGMGAAQVGAPESVGPRVSAYVTAGGFGSLRHSGGVMQRDQRFMVMFVYRLDKAEATAETTLMGLVDAFLAAVQADLSLGGTVNTAQLDGSAADEPSYQLRAGQEYREYPVIVTVTQRGTYTVNP